MWLTILRYCGLWERNGGERNETEEEREIVWQKKNMRGKDSSRMRDRNREIEAYSE